MERTLAVINQLEQAGLIGRYAIGGAVAAARYIEPVQMIEEALAQAVGVEFGSTPTRVFSAEYLAAIMLQTGRPKDHARLIQFFESNVLDRAALERIAAQHGLAAQWDNFRRRFLNENA